MWWDGRTIQQNTSIAPSFICWHWRELGEIFASCFVRFVHFSTGISPCTEDNPSSQMCQTQQPLILNHTQSIYKTSLPISRTLLSPIWLLQQINKKSSYDVYTDKLANLQDFVESNLVAAADQQKIFLWCVHSSLRTLNIGDHVWLSVPTAGKLDPQ